MLRASRAAVGVVCFAVGCSSFAASPSPSDPGDGGDGGGSEGGIDGGDAASPSSCPGLLCEDFDDDAGTSRWQSLAVDEITIGVDAVDTKPPSAPNAFAVSAANVKFGSTGRISHDLGLPTNGVTCDVWVKIGTSMSRGVARFAAITVDSRGGAAYAATVELQNDGRTTLVEDVDVDGGTGSDIGPSLGTAQWEDVTLTLDRRASTFTVKIAGSSKTISLPYLPTDATALGLTIGLVFGNPFGGGAVVPFAARFDAVRCTALN